MDRAYNKALGGFKRVAGLSKVVWKILLPILSFHTVPALSAGISLTWIANPNPAVVGYNIYYEGTSGVYTNMINVGNVTSATISGLVGGATYYITATCYDSFGDQSAFSNETSHTVPIPSQVQLRAGSAGQFIVTVIGQIGHTYEIQATQDFKTWTTIGMSGMGLTGSLDFVDMDAQNFSARFYRACDLQL